MPAGGPTPSDVLPVLGLHTGRLIWGNPLVRAIKMNIRTRKLAIPTLEHLTTRGSVSVEFPHSDREWRFKSIAPPFAISAHSPTPLSTTAPAGHDVDFGMAA